jgi:hypothetical protein
MTLKRAMVIPDTPGAGTYEWSATDPDHVTIRVRRDQVIMIEIDDAVFDASDVLSTGDYDNMITRAGIGFDTGGEGDALVQEPS